MASYDLSPQVHLQYGVDKVATRGQVSSICTKTTATLQYPLRGEGITTAINYQGDAFA
jgi:hypothetical protein